MSFRRADFFLLCSFFSFSRFIFCDRLTFVGTRFFGTTSARASIDANFSIASLRLAACERLVSSWSTRKPSLLIRFFSFRRARFFCAGVRRDVSSRLKRSVTFVDTLFTFWPPGPEERAAVMTISSSGMVTLPVIRIMAAVR